MASRDAAAYRRTSPRERCAAYMRERATTSEYCEAAPPTSSRTVASARAARYCTRWSYPRVSRSLRWLPSCVARGGACMGARACSRCVRTLARDRGAADCEVYVGGGAYAARGAARASYARRGSGAPRPSYAARWGWGTGTYGTRPGAGCGGARLGGRHATAAAAATAVAAAAGAGRALGAAATAAALTALAPPPRLIPLRRSATSCW